MKKFPRGFLFVRNMKTGESFPFFLKVREQDIIWKDGTTTRDDVIDTGVLDGWLYETHSLLSRISLSKRTSIPTLEFESTRQANVTVTLPRKVRLIDGVVTISKESNDVRILENSIIEAVLIDADANGLSNTLKITLTSPLGEFTQPTITTVTGMMNVIIQGFYE